MDKNQKIIIGVVGLVLFLGIGASWLFWWGKGDSGQSQEPENNLKSQSAQRILAEEKMPIIELEINRDRSGAVLTISEIDADFIQLEYELIYLAESDTGQEIERGVAGGPIDIDSSRSVSENLLFGTESCTTGVCHRRIDKNVSGGTVIIRLIDEDNQPWPVEKEFTIQEANSGYTSVWID